MPPRPRWYKFPSLAATATNLNEASKELSEVIERIDDALQRLNLGVTAWVKVQGDNTSDVSATALSCKQPVSKSLPAGERRTQ